MQINLLLCEDDTQYIDIFTQEIKRVAQKLEVTEKITVTKTGEELLFYYDDLVTDIDIIYLDVLLSGIDGMEVAHRLRDRGFRGEIIFYTKEKNRILEAFDVDAMHFILKDKIDEKKFDDIFAKGVKKIGKMNQEVLLLSCAGENRKISISDIHYFEVNRRIITVYYGEKEKFEFYSRLNRLEEILEGKGFIRIHMSYLVAIRYIERMTYESIILKDGIKLPLGRSYHKEVKNQLNQP